MGATAGVTAVAIATLLPVSVKVVTLGSMEPTPESSFIIPPVVFTPCHVIVSVVVLVVGDVHVPCHCRQNLQMTLRSHQPKWPN